MVSETALLLIEIFVTAFAIGMGGVVGKYYVSQIPPRLEESQKRAKIVYEDYLLTNIEKIERDVECARHPSEIDINEVSSLIFQKSIEGLKELNEAIKKYRDILSITLDRFKPEKEKIVKDYDKAFQEATSGRFVRASQNNNEISKLTEGLEWEIIEAILKGEKISLEWFKSLRNRERDKLDKYNVWMTEHSGKPLSLMFDELDKLRNDSSMGFLRECKENCLNKVSKVRKVLEKEKKKLKSIFGFIYGAGDKEKLKQLEEKNQLEESLIL
ncbi:hypothetical protein ES705_10761 [subsurface metagenome]|nr:hypothetical protein [Methanosarcinales archaeon]